MKNKLFIALRTIFLGVFIASLSTSCADYLDVDKYFKDMLTIDTVFSKRTTTDQWLTNVYSKLNDVVTDITKGTNGGGVVSNLVFASDDVIYGDWSDRCEKYQNGEYNASDNLQEDRWGRVYEGIRDASLFIHNVDKCEEMSLTERTQAKAQARFLRAYYYFVLLRQYGPILMIPDEGLSVSASYEELALPRSPYDECVEFVVEELAQAARGLPNEWPKNVYTRATRGAALAVRAKMLLYAASPLYNGNTDLSSLKSVEGENLINQVYEESKWARAAAAAKELIEFAEETGQYALLRVPVSETTVAPPAHAVYSNNNFPDGWADLDPFESYRQIFNGELAPSINPELIFMRTGGASKINHIVEHAAPREFGTYNTLGVTQKQVEAYYMRNGRNYKEQGSESFTPEQELFTEHSGEYDFLPANVSLVYANKEPRFYASVAFNGSVWENLSTSASENKNKQYFYYKGEQSGKLLSSPGFYIRTGIGLKKYYNPEDAWRDGGQRVAKAEPTIRYADVLLWYAEALNEITSGKEYTFERYNEEPITVQREVSEMRRAMKQIRMRAGVPDFQDEVYNNADIFRTYLKRERQIELMAEGARYFDLRRWKDAEVQENMPLTGCNMEMRNTDGQREKFYYPIAINMRKSFHKRMYLWPIPMNEIRRNPNLVQNPGW